MRSVWWEHSSEGRWCGGGGWCVGIKGGRYIGKGGRIGRVEGLRGSKGEREDGVSERREGWKTEGREEEDGSE